jgi:uncharacterized DUF497 family protein
VKIVWDEKKNDLLIKTRGVSFEEIVELILQNKYLAILEHKKRKGQFLFIFNIHDYTHAVPFIIDKEDNIVLKTIFPSRKFHKIYGVKNDESKA